MRECKFKVGTSSKSNTDIEIKGNDPKFKEIGIIERG